MNRILLVFVAFAVAITVATSEQAYPACLDKLGDCDWYTNCLEREYKCENVTDNYPSGFAYPICSEMMNQRESFSEAGQKWVDGVRLCLQEKIVPELRRLGPAATCQHAEELAFQIHYDCYIENGYCQIPYDWPRIINIVKYTIFSSKWRVIMSQGFSIITTCMFG